jgi:type I restriction enzyme R subunit
MFGIEHSWGDAPGYDEEGRWPLKPSVSRAVARGYDNDALRPTNSIETGRRKIPGKTMNKIGKSERATQNRIIKLFKNELGYKSYGNLKDELGNDNIEESYLTKNLRKRGYTDAEISAAIYRLRLEATNTNRSLYENNKAVYSLLRYGVDVKTQAGGVNEKVHLIDWETPEDNEFGIAEEVTLSKGGHDRRPDLVLYINGIAFGVIELKNSRVSIGDGIRQNLSNQQPEFNEWFFTTTQILFAGNDTEGLRYGTILTPEKFYLSWKEDVHENTRLKLDKYLLKMCEKTRILELMHDFVLFDGGVKKLPRAHQYFGVRSAQKHVEQRKNGIIWHTQGSGKSIVMVMLAKWILENHSDARVLIVTDRDALDKQILRVMRDAGLLSSDREDDAYRVASRSDLRSKLGAIDVRILTSLVQKFGLRKSDGKGLNDQEFAALIKELGDQPSPVSGQLFVFVDECHRTQSGRLNQVMRTLMPEAVFFGFTGTPLLAKDKKTSREMFGDYIHTYKFTEAVEDEVVLDLIYESRDIETELTSPQKIDAWFDAKTKGLNDWQKDELKKKWATMQNVLSSRSRMNRIVADVAHDFGVKPRLISSRGNAMLVAASIHDACKYFDLLQNTPLRNRCAIITSYDPAARDVSLEETGQNNQTQKQFVYDTYTKLLESVKAEAGMTKTESYEESAKKLFTEQPANMRLLVVVDKLLTGFDAPSCTYLYLDKSMQDHGLFQAICRTNRLDGEDKDFGYIVDYKDLFKKVEKAISVYTSEIDDSTDNDTDQSSEILMQQRLTKGKERLDTALEAAELVCEGVEEPKAELEQIRYFCGNTEIPSDLQECEPRRAALYKTTVTLTRAYANIADELSESGYSDAEIDRIKARLDFFVKLRDTIRLAAGETLDLKPYEADMRHLIDHYIKAEESTAVEGLPSLMDMIVKTGIADAIANRLSNLKGNKDAIAEVIGNNVRSTVVKKKMNDPVFYERMSELLDEVIQDLKAGRVEYETYLEKIAAIARQVDAGTDSSVDPRLDTQGKRALFNTLESFLSNTTENYAGVGEAKAATYSADSQDAAQLALQIHSKVIDVREDNWFGDQTRESGIQRAIHEILKNEEQTMKVFAVVAAQAEYRDT